ncbi:MAG TPA: DPP IV N-terminal domain-containing protein [Acidisarcina sp.]
MNRSIAHHLSQRPALRVAAAASSLLFAGLAAGSDAPAAQPLAAPAAGLTVESIYAHGSLTGEPPGDFAWSPDSNHVLYRSSNGDVFSVDREGVVRLFISHLRISVLTSAPATERDRDHRARYGQLPYIWGPDSEHLLLDTAGDIVVYSPRTGTGVQVASTGMGSGDDPKFSPNGSYVSYVKDHNLFLRRLRSGGEEVALTRVRDGSRNATVDPARLVLNGEVDWVYEEELNVRSNYYWSPDSGHIAFLEMDESLVPEYPIADWIPIHTAVDRQRYPQPGDPNPAVRLGVVTNTGSKTVWVKLPGDRGNDYIPRFGWINPRVLWVETLSRDQKHLNLYFADAQTGESRLALAQTEEKFFTTTYDVDFTASDFYLSSWRDGHTHIYRYSFNAGNPMSGDAVLRQQVTSGPYEVREIAAIDEPSETIYYTSNEDDPLGQQLWAVQTDGTGKHRISKPGGFHSVTFASEGGLYLDEYSDAKTPPTISFCHKSDCKVLWSSTPLSFELTPLERLVLKDGAGTGTLFGSLLLPANSSAPASVPLIVNPYGGPGAQGVRDEWGKSGRLFDELLAQRGYAVLHVDNRGMAGRGRDFEQSAYRDFGPVQLADQLAAVDQVLAKYPQLDRIRLGWWGWSWGGTFTLYAMSHSERFRAGVAGAPVTDWRNYDSIYTERYLGLPGANADVYRDDSVINTAADLKGRLLLLHGTGDDNVHLGNSVQYIQQLIDAGIPYDFQIFPRKTHSASGAETQFHFHARMLEHFDRYLKPDRISTGQSSQ